LYEVCKKAHEIVQARHEAQIQQVYESRQEALASATRKQARARTSEGMKDKSDALALKGIDQRNSKKGGKSVRSAIREEKDEEKEEGEEEEEEEEEEEDEDNSITSNSTSSTGSRGGSNKRKAEQARLLGMIEKKKKEEEEKKKKDDPQWQMVNMFKKEKEGGEGDGEAARLVEVLLRKEMREEEKARQNQEEIDMKFLLDTAKWMKENNVTEDGLPYFVKQKWDKLNKKGDD